MLAPQEIRTFFVTAVTAQRRSIFQVERNAELFLQLLRDDQTKKRYAVHAFVIMRDHIHLLLTPAPDIPLEKAMQFIKGGFSFRLQGLKSIWERSFNEHRIKDANDYWKHVPYIEENPGRAGYSENYRYASTHQRDIIVPAPAHFEKRQG